MTNAHYDQKLEATVLGTLLLESNALIRVLTILKPLCFYFSENKIVYNAIIELHESKQAIDTITVANKLRANNTLDQIGGAYFLSQLSNNVGSSTHLEEHCRILYELYLRRELITLLQYKIQEIDSNNDIFDIYNNLSIKSGDLFNMNFLNEYHRIDEVIYNRLEKIGELKPDQNGLIGLHTGFSKLNNFTNGFQAGDYVLLGARPSMGKTRVALLIGLACILISGKKLLFFSLEMSKERIADVIVSILTEIDSKKISGNKLSDSDWAKIDAFVSRLIKSHFYIIDDSGMSIETIKNRAISIYHEVGIDEIIIDYLQLISHSFPKRNTNDNVTHISKNLKVLAKSLKLPVIALSQLSREGDIFPSLKHLRDSGSLEQDADIVWFLFREDYEGRECDAEAKCRIDNIIAKNRNGEIGAFYTYRNDNWSYIGEIEYSEYISLKDSEMPFNEIKDFNAF